MAVKEPAFLGEGWHFPIRVTPQYREFEAVSGSEDIKQSIFLILSTAAGERVMRPDFGCGIHELVFDTLSAGVLGLIETSVRDALRTYEPRIEVEEVLIDQRAARAGRLDVTIEYRIHSTNQRDNLVFPFYFREG